MAPNKNKNGVIMRMPRVHKPQAETKTVSNFCIKKFALSFFSIAGNTTGIFNTLWDEQNKKYHHHHTNYARDNFISSLRGVYFNDEVTPMKLMRYRCEYFPSFASSLPSFARLKDMLIKENIIVRANKEQQEKIMDLLSLNVESHVACHIVVPHSGTVA